MMKNLLKNGSVLCIILMQVLLCNLAFAGSGDQSPLQPLTITGKVTSIPEDDFPEVQLERVVRKYCN